jgi:hypothetical protein
MKQIGDSRSSKTDYLSAKLSLADWVRAGNCGVQFIYNRERHSPKNQCICSHCW